MNALILGKSELGKAVFADKNFKKGEKIIEWQGPILTKKKIPEIKSPEDDRYTQIGIDKYICASGKMDDFINHSCDPNSGLLFQKKKIFLIAIKDIPLGDEITWDYSTTMDEDVNGNGINDLMLHFRFDETGLDCEEISRN